MKPIYSNILKAIILTEISIIGTFLMVSYKLDNAPFLFVWGSVLATIIFLAWQWGGLTWDTNADTPHNQLIYFALLLNGICINMGFYFILIVCLKFYMGYRITILGV